MNKTVKWLLLAAALGFGGLLMLLILVAALGGSVKKNTVVHLVLDGEINELPNASLETLLSDEEPLSFVEIVLGIRAAATDEKVVGLLLEVKSPEIGLAQVQELNTAMNEFRGSGKWSLAFVETVGEMQRGDGLYALAATADEIMMAPSGDITLAGLRAEVPFLRGTLDRLKIEAVVEKRHDFKNAADTFTETNFTPAHKEAVSSLLDDLQAAWIDLITARRTKDRDAVKAWIQNSPHTSIQAKEQGMIDRIGYWDEALALLSERAGREEPLMELAEYRRYADHGAAKADVALIYAEGTIMRGPSESGMSSSAGSDSIAQAFRDARKAKVDGVLFRINSPGGSYVASDLIRREVQLTREAGIPVVVSMGNVAASGGYLVALEGDHILAEPSTITGSIGVIAAGMATRQFFKEWLGITFGVYETDPGAGILNGLDPPTEQQRERLRRAADDIYEAFVDLAANRRNKTYDDLHAVAQGRVWSGTAAKEHGLIDELGGFQRAVEVVKEKAGLAKDDLVALHIYPKPKTGLAALFEMFGAHASLPIDLARLRAVSTQLRLLNGGTLAVAPVPEVDL